MEILDLYDIDRRKTGRTYVRGDMVPKDSYRLIVHAAIFDQNKLLIQQRADEKKMGGKWDISCGGACQSGEDSQDAIARELYEELGLCLNFKKVRPALTINFDVGFDDFYIINKKIDLKKLILQKEEVKDVRIASLDEVLAMVDDGRFLSYRKSFIRLLFDLSKDPRVIEW